MIDIMSFYQIIRKFLSTFGRLQLFSSKSGKQAHFYQHPLFLFILLVTYLFKSRSTFIFVLNLTRPENIGTLY